MQVDYLPEHREFKESVESFVSAQALPLLTQYDLDARLGTEGAHDLWNALRNNSPLGDVPRSDKGEIDYLALGLLLEALAYGNGNLPFMYIAGMHFPASLDETLTDEQRVLCKRILTPGHFVAAALSEPGVGSNPTEMRTIARRDGNSYVISGTKLWCSSADHSDGLMLACLIEEGDGNKPVMGQLLLDRAVTAYQVNPIDTLGLRSTALCELVFDDLRAPATSRITGIFSDRAGMQMILQRGRLQMAAVSVGMAQRALDLSLRYAKERSQFGRMIGGFQLIQEMLAQMYTEVSLARLAMVQGFRNLTAGVLTPKKEASMAKAYATEAAVRVANLGVQIHGAMGITKEAEIESILRNARMMTFPDGTTQIHTLVMGR